MAADLVMRNSIYNAVAFARSLFKLALTALGLLALGILAFGRLIALLALRGLVRHRGVGRSGNSALPKLRESGRG